MRKIAFLACLAILVPNTFAQTCKLLWNDERRCLPVSELGGDTIVIPSNTSRLGQAGLELCPIQATETKVPAVLFIVDQSTSMDNMNGSDPAGDPLHWRATLVRNAIRYLNEIAPGGWFGYVEFANDVNVELDPNNTNCFEGINEDDTRLDSYPFTRMSESLVNLWTSEESPVQTRCKSGTNYYAALRQAKQFLADFDPGDLPAEPAIIFISDGRPSTDEDRTFEPLATDFEIPGVMPPIHGIFLGADSTADGDVLAMLSDSTNGTYNLVDAGDTAAMTVVMDNIIRIVTQYSIPAEVKLEVNGISYQAPAPRPGIGNYVAQFPSDIQLQEGSNLVQLQIGYRDETTGLMRNRITQFTLDASGPEAEIGDSRLNNYFEMSCVTGNSLKIGDLVDPQIYPGMTRDNAPIVSPSAINGLPIDMLAADLETDSGYIRVVSARTRDTLVLYLALSEAQHFLGQLPATQVGTSRSGTAQRGNPTDGLLQYAEFDTLSFLWVNPQEDRDSITGSVLIYEQPTLAFAADTLSIDQISTEVQCAAILRPGTLVDLLWIDNSWFAQQSLPRVDSTSTFAAITNLKEVILDSRPGDSSTIIAQFVDPIFGDTLKDTAFLIFDVPVLPTAWLIDGDGDGRADTLQLTFAEPRRADQHFPDYMLVWGAANQDTVYLRVDSLNPELSFREVEIVTRNGRETWTFALANPLPFAHTSGSGVLGEGKLLMEGWFAGKNTSREIAVEDKVGPVLTKAWVDPVEPYWIFFRASEWLAPGFSGNLLLDRTPATALEEELRAVDSLTWSTSTEIFKGYLTNSNGNFVRGGDSLRLAPLSMSGIRDLAGNASHPYNPAVLVEGNRSSGPGIRIGFERPMITADAEFDLPPWEDSSPDHFRVLTTLDEGVDIQQVARAMPTMGITVELPTLNGLDAQGNTLEGMMVDGELAFATTITARSWFFDATGQFIILKTATYDIEDIRLVRPDGSVQLALVWDKQTREGIRDANGRLVGTGLLLVKTEVSVSSEALVDVDVYDENGNLTDRSLKTGNIQTRKTSGISRLGYRR